MPFGKYETPKLPTIPTFLQYIKTCGKGVETKTKFAVDVVWLPGKFDNVTLQSHAFRYICDNNHPLYEEVKRYFDIVVPGNNYPKLEIVIDSLEQRTISVSEATRKQGTWEKMGANAMKFKE
jgi:hypothetical protein